MTRAYRVHIGRGRSPWVYFDTLDKARDYCRGFFESSGVVLCIEKVSPCTPN